jgi:hypothetical protein
MFSFDFWHFLSLIKKNPSADISRGRTTQSHTGKSHIQYLQHVLHFTRLRRIERRGLFCLSAFFCSQFRRNRRKYPFFRGEFSQYCIGCHQSLRRPNFITDSANFIRPGNQIKRTSPLSQRNALSSWRPTQISSKSKKKISSMILRY